MSQDRLIEKTLGALGIPVKYYEYEGTKTEYIVYNEEVEQPTDHADNEAQDHITWWQIHIFTPKNGGFRNYKESAVELLNAAGFYVTDIVTRFEKETKTIHVAISCHAGEMEE